MCKVISDPNERRMFDSKTKEVIKTLAAKQTEPHRNRETQWVHMKIMQTCLIISGPAQTKQQTKEQLRY